MDGGIHVIGEAAVYRDPVSAGIYVAPLVPELLLATPFSTTVGKPNLERLKLQMQMIASLDCVCLSFLPQNSNFFFEVSLTALYSASVLSKSLNFSFFVSSVCPNISQSDFLCTNITNIFLKVPQIHINRAELLLAHF